MKNVIMISYLFSENENIGSHRSQGLAKYLPLNNWHPIVVTRKTDKPMIAPEYELIEVPFEDKIKTWKKKFGWDENTTIKEQKGLPDLKREDTVFDKSLALLLDVFFYPDESKSWIDPASKKIREIIESREIHAIISTSSPITSHIIAHGIKKKYGVPWLADFRDLWSQNHYHTTMIRDIHNKISEKRVISDADTLSTVSEPLASTLNADYPRKEVLTILNGYNPIELNPGTNIDDRFRIVYTGILYKGVRDPEPLFHAIKELINEGKIIRSDVLIEFYGRSEGWLFTDVENYGFDDIVRIHGLVTRNEVIQEQRKAQILLLLTWNNPEERGVYTGKLFEYVAAQRPILLLGATEGVASKLLDENKIGRAASTVEDIKSILLNFYREYKDKGQVQYHGEIEMTQSLSQTRMASEFSRALDNITDLKK